MINSPPERFNIDNKSILASIRAHLGLVRQGAKIRDKLAIINYILSMPLHLLYQKLGKKYEHKYSKDILLSNQNGIYNCGNGVSAVLSCSDLTEGFMRKYFEVKNGAFIDVGAHIGKYSVYVGKKLDKSTKGIAIEANEKNFVFLKKNLKINKLNNVIAYNNICSDRNGKMKFYNPANWHEGSTGGSTDKLKDSVEVTLDSVKIDTLVKKNKIKKVDLIKIDVEGGVIPVLKGALRTIKKDHPAILFEVLSNNDLDSATKMLKKQGYNIKKLDYVNYLAK